MMSATAICHHKSNQAVHPSKMRNALWVLRLILLVFLPRAASFPLFRANSNILEVGAERNLEKKDVLLSTTGSFDRRDMFRLVSAFMLAVPFPAGAGEVGARITKAVTTSDVGVSVRTSVVKGAQTMDKLDGMWENFSDKYGLGAERSKAGKRPTPKVIPPILPLDVATAKLILSISDQTFSSVTGIRLSVMEEQTQKVANLVRISFERSGVKVDANNPLEFSNDSQYNFVVYCHFKAYSDLILEQQIPFAPFRSKFEQQIGQELVTRLLPEYKANSNDSVKDKFNAAVTAVDTLCRNFCEKGFVAAIEIETVDDDKICDWIDDISDLEFNISLDGDATLNAQILLQEQGFRLYPNFAKYAINHLMSQVDGRQKVTTMDYYFDTDYNSDPDKFEVKEVLLTVSIENP